MTLERIELTPPDALCVCGHRWFDHIMQDDYACGATRGGDRVDDCSGFVSAGEQPRAVTQMGSQVIASLVTALIGEHNANHAVTYEDGCGCATCKLIDRARDPKFAADASSESTQGRS